MKAPPLMMVKRGNALVPADRRAADALSAIPDGSRVGISVRRGRSNDHHNLFWAILERVADASQFETPERLLIALKIRLGKYDLMSMPNGKVVPVPSSISFAAMGQDEFQKFFDDSMRVICEEVLDGPQAADLIEMIAHETGAPRQSAGRAA